MPADDAQAKRPGAQEITDWLVENIRSELGLPDGEIDTTLPFAEHGLDSVHALRLTTSLADWLGRRATPEFAYDYPTIDLLARHLASAPTDSPIAEPVAAQRPQTVATHNLDEPIAIIGIGCRFPGADGPSAYWRLLADGVDAITQAPPDRWTDEAFEHTHQRGSGNNRWGGFLDYVDQFDADFFGISPREAVRMDPQQRLVMEVGWEALEDAGQVPQRLAGSATGVFLGISTNEYALIEYSQPTRFDAYTGTGMALSVAANRLSYAFDLHGPSIAIDTACSSSLVAVHLACRSLRDAECDLALVGGVNLVLSPALNVVLTQAGVIAPDGRCKTFDARADGYVRGEGAAVVVLKPLSRALADGDRLYAIIRGSATNQDGRTNGLMAPSPRSQEAVLTEAYRRAGVSPGAVQYVEAHGTGTLLGDAIEANALGTVLARGRTPESRCLVGSHKSNIGHLEAAAGVAGLIKVALALHHRMIPPTLHYIDPNPNIAFDGLPLKVADTLVPWPPGAGRAIAGVSSFGFGGTNAHVVLAAAPQIRDAPRRDVTDNRSHVLPLSAKSPTALTALAGRYLDALTDGTSLADLCYTAAARRGHHDHRLAVTGASRAQLTAGLVGYRNGTARAGLSVGRCRAPHESKVAFVFSGHGSQWFGMGQLLYAQEGAFRNTLEACDQAIHPYLGESVLSDLFAAAEWSRLDDIGIAQPAIFAVQVALAALWSSWGVHPDAVIGHSMGEVAAAHVAGALTLDDAARVICERARVLRGASGCGAMLAAELSTTEARRVLDRNHRSIHIAASNSHRSTVLSGERETLAEVMAELEQTDRFCRWIDVDVAAHSPHIQALSGELVDALRGLRPASATVPMCSTVTGELFANTLVDEHYWAQNLSAPVQFAAGVRRLLDLGYDAFVEVSPHPMLLSAVGEDGEHLGRSCVLLPSMRRDDGSRATLLASLGALYAGHRQIAWQNVYSQGEHCISAPTYPWQHERHWLDPTIDDLSNVVDSDLAAAQRSASAPHVRTVEPGKPRPDVASEEVRNLPPSQRQQWLATYLVEQVADRLGLDTARVDVESPVDRLGVDSLIAMELRNRIQRDLGIGIPVVRVLDGRSVGDLAEWLAQHLCAADSATTERVVTANQPPAESNSGPVVAAVTSSTWIGMLTELASVSDENLDDMLQEVLAARRKRTGV